MCETLTLLVKTWFSLTNTGKTSINSLYNKKENTFRDKIQLVGFGTFEVAERAARTGRNPQTGADMEIPASKSPKFKAGKALKDIVNA